MALRVSGCALFGVPTTLLMASGYPFIETQKVASKFYTQDLHTRKIFKLEFLL